MKRHDGYWYCHQALQLLHAQRRTLPAAFRASMEQYLRAALDGYIADNGVPEKGSERLPRGAELMKARAKERVVDLGDRGQ